MSKVLLLLKYCKGLSLPEIILKTPQLCIHFLVIYVNFLNPVYCLGHECWDLHFSCNLQTSKFDCIFLHFVQTENTSLK